MHLLLDPLPFAGAFDRSRWTSFSNEARELIDSGATELNLISQDLTSFGSENGGDYELPKLLEKLNDLDGARWIRLLYTYPYKFSDAMIDAVAELPKVVNYIDMPIQHINDRMLRRMGRRMGEQGTRDLFYRMRERIEDLVLRTTFIVGFPGETDEEFQQLVEFVREMRLERVGVFTYSDEDGTPAVKLNPKIDPEVQQQRLETLMLAQQQVAFEWNRTRVGQELEVLIDGFDVADDGSARPLRSQLRRGAGDR